MKFCKKHITKILIICIIVLTIIVPVASSADEYIVSKEQPENSTYSGSVSQYQLKLNINIDKRTQDYFEKDNWKVVSNSSDDNNLQAVEKVYEIKSYIDGDELEQYTNNLTAVYPDSISSIFPIDFSSRYRIQQNESESDISSGNINSVYISVPPIIDYSINGELYKEFIVNLYKIYLNGMIDENLLNKYLNKDILTTAKEIILNEQSNANQLNNNEFVELLYFSILKRRASNECFEKYAGYLNNEQCTREDLIGNFLMSYEFKISTLDAYDLQISKNNINKKYENNTTEKAISEKNKLKNYEVDKEMFCAYIAQVYLTTIGNGEKCISEKQLNELYDNYNNGDDLEEILIKLFTSKEGNNYIAKKAEDGNEQFVISMYGAILGDVPSECIKKIAINNLKYENKIDWIKQNIINSSEFGVLKKNLASGYYVPINFLNEKKITVDICTKTKGDLNGDLIINAQDARVLLKVVIDASLGNEDKYVSDIDYLDINGDGEVNTIDAQWILQYYLYTIKSENFCGFEEFLRLNLN